MYTPNEISSSGSSIASTTIAMCADGFIGKDRYQIVALLGQLGIELSKSIKGLNPNMEVIYVNVPERVNNPNGSMGHFAFIQTAKPCTSAPPK